VRRLGFLLLVLLVPSLVPAQTGNQLYVVLPKTKWTFGEAIKPQVVMRNGDGVLLPTPTVSWFVDPPSAGTVSSDGTFTPSDLSTAVIRAVGPLNLRAEVLIQVLPKTIEVIPEHSSMTIGSTQTIRAQALDINDQPIPGIHFLWRLENLLGAWNIDTPMASIDIGGRLTALAQGQLGVLATIPYPGGPRWLPGFLSEAYGSTAIGLQAKQTYTFERVLAADANNLTHQLMGRPTILLPTEDDGFVFAGSLDNVTSALLEWKSGSFNPLLSAGRSHSSTRQPLVNFNAYARNHRGDMLTMESDTNGSSQVSAGPGDSQLPLLVPRTPLFLAERTDFFESQRNSLADNGMKIVRANYLDAVSRTNEQGLFRGTGKGLEDVVVTTSDGLPGHPGDNFQFFKYGIAADGTAWFTTNFPSNNQTVLWRRNVGGAIEKILSTGDVFQGSEVTGVQVGGDWNLNPGLFVASNGDVVVAIATRTRSYFLRWNNGQADPESLSDSTGGVYWHEPGVGTLIRTNHSNRGDGLYLWGAGTDVQSLLRIGEQVEGAAVTDIYSAAVNSHGVIFAMVATTDLPMIILRLSPDRQVVAKAGDPLALPIPPTMTAFFPGRRTGSPLILTEGLTGSVGTIMPDNHIQPVLSVGDPLPGGARFAGSSKDQVFAVDDQSFVFVAQSAGIFRSSPSGVERIVKMPLANGLGPPFAFKLNSSGVMAAQVYSGNLTGTYQFINPNFTPVVQNNDVIDGEVFTGMFSGPAIDDSGRIAFQFTNDRGNHVALWDGKRTTRVLWKGFTLPDGRTVTNFNGVKAGKDSFVVDVTLADNSNTLISYGANSWQILAGKTDRMPTGNYVGWIDNGRFDVNSSGDVAFSFASGTAQHLVVRRGNEFNEVYDFSALTQSGELLLAITDLHLNDDGTLYVLATNDADQQVIYRGTPGVRASTVTESQAYALNAKGSMSAATSGAAANTTAGFARIQPDTDGNTPFGVAIFGLRQNSVLITEAGVPAVPLIRSGIFYAEAGGNVNTGIAIANPGNSVAAVNFTIAKASGETLKSGLVTVGAGSQIAGFLDQEPFNTTNVQGTLSFSSSVPIGVTALHGLVNERGNFLTTTLPVVDTSTPLQGNQYLPQFAIGGQWSTQFILVNPTSNSIEGTFAFYSNASADSSGQPLSVNFGGQEATSFNYLIPAHGMQRYVPSLSGGSSATGFIAVSPKAGAAAPSAVAVFTFRNNNVTIAEAGVNASPVGKAFRTYVELNGNFPAGSASSISTGVAVANTTTSPASVSVELFDQNGVTTGASGTVRVPASGHISAFVHQIPGLENFSRDFKGTMRITSDNAISVLALRGRYNELSDFLITTLPVMTEGTTLTGDRIFPHIADGGGYSTQFILIAPDAGSSTGTLRFFNQSGQPLGLQLRY